MRIFRWLAFAGFALSLAFSLRVFHKIGRITDGQDSGAASLPSKLDDLAALDKTGTLGKLAKAQQDELQRLGNLPDLGEESNPAPSRARPERLAPAEVPAGPVSVSDTNSGRTKVKVSDKGDRSIEPKKGRAVLVDSLGRRYEVRSAPAARAAGAKMALTRLPKLNAPSLLPEESGLEARKRWASILLLGTALGTIAAVVSVRKKFFPG